MLWLCLHLALGARPSSQTLKVLQPAGSHKINPRRASIIMLCVGVSFAAPGIEGLLMLL